MPKGEKVLKYFWLVLEELNLLVAKITVTEQILI